MPKTPALPPARTYRLFLDDQRLPRDVKWIALPPGPWVVARSYDEFVAEITDRGLPAFVTFDHDLADEHYVPGSDPSTYRERTGLDCARWLVDLCIAQDVDLPEYAVHSMNPLGRENIESLLASAARHMLVERNRVKALKEAS